MIARALLAILTIMGCAFAGFIARAATGVTEMGFFVPLILGFAAAFAAVVIGEKR